MTRKEVGAVDSVGIEPKRMSTGLARKSAMLSGKMMSLGEANELHKKPGFPPTWRTNCQRFRSEQSTGGVNPSCLFVQRGESRAKNLKVAHEHTEHREYNEFILVRASGE
jgi:hypothetical protein